VVKNADLVRGGITHNGSCCGSFSANQEEMAGSSFVAALYSSSLNPSRTSSKQTARAAATIFVQLELETTSKNSLKQSWSQYRLLPAR
jgi:hypothetical protein